MKIHQKAFAVIFMASLLIFSICNMVFQFDEIKSGIMDVDKPKKASDVKVTASQIDSVFTEELLFGHGWNELYAHVYNACLKNEENSFAYVRDKNGMLYAGNFWNLPTATSREYMDRILELKKQVEDKGTKVMVLMYPCLYNEAWSDGYKGIPYTDYNELGDELAAYFRYYGIDYIDYRQTYIENGMKAEEIFYKTDHHWRIETAFDAFVELTEYLNEKYDEKLDTYYTDLNNYEIVTYEKFFIGSQGRDAGVNYVGADDFSYILPKFDTEYTYTYLGGGKKEEKLRGPMEGTMINTRVAEIKDIYDRDFYSAYMGGVRYYDDVVNHKNPEGLNVLFLRDSFSSPLATYFSSYCNRMELYWNVNTTPEELENAVETGEYDYIFIGLAIDSIATDGMEFYLEEEEKADE